MFADQFSLGFAIGCGTYGTIFTCTHRRTGVIYSVKVIQRIDVGPTGVEAIQREVELLKRLRHPHIVQLLAFYEEETTLYMVMEGFPGEGLSSKLIEGCGLPESIVCSIIRNLLSAVEIIHLAGVCHRDLSPDKIMLKEKTRKRSIAQGGDKIKRSVTSNISLMDFGSFMYLNKPQEEQTSNWLGSVDFNAPEILDPTHGPVTTKCDIWSIGAMTYMLLCGYPPFYAKSESELFRQTLDFSGHSWSSISSQAKDFISTMLKVNISDRPDACEASMHPWISDVPQDVTPTSSRVMEPVVDLEAVTPKLPSVDSTAWLSELTKDDGQESAALKDVLLRAPSSIFSLRDSSTISEAFQFLSDMNVLSCPVVNQSGYFCGVLDVLDLLDMVLQTCSDHNITCVRCSPYRLSRLLHPNASHLFSIPISQVVKNAAMRIRTVNPLMPLIEFVNETFVDPAEEEGWPTHRVTLVTDSEGAMFSVLVRNGMQRITPTNSPTISPQPIPHVSPVPVIVCDYIRASALPEKELKPDNYLTQSTIIQYLVQRPVLLGALAKRTLNDLGLADKQVFSLPSSIITLHAFMFMRERGLTSVAVTDNDGRLVGSIEASDIRGFTVSNIMALTLPVNKFLSLPFQSSSTQRVITCSSRGSVLSALQLCTYHRIHRIYIVNTRNEPISLVTLTDLLRAYVHHFTGAGSCSPLPVSPFPPVMENSWAREEAFSELHKVSLLGNSHNNTHDFRFRHRATTSKVFPEVDDQPLIVVMVGLPGRGKSYISKRICRYLNWKGVPASVFNAGEYRRRLLGNHHDQSWFDPQNAEGRHQRQQMADMAVDDLIKWIQEGGQAGILDATNTERERRKVVVEAFKQKLKLETSRVLFLEIVCTQEELIDKTILEVKMKNKDYVAKEKDQGYQDFKRRIAQYASVYQPLSVEEDSHLSFIRLINVGEDVVLHKVRGSLPTNLMLFVMHLRAYAPPIYICRHGETLDTVQGKLGGNAPLTVAGMEFARKLKEHFDAIAAKEGRETITVWTSTSQGGVGTCEPFTKSSTYNVKQYKLLDDLRFGECEGMTFDQVRRNMPDVWRSLTTDECFHTWPGGESPHALVHRLEPVLLDAEAITTPLLIVCSASVCRCLYSYFKDVPLEQCVKMIVPQDVVYELNIEIEGTNVKPHHVT